MCVTKRKTLRDGKEVESCSGWDSSRIPRIA